MSDEKKPNLFERHKAATVILAGVFVFAVIAAMSGGSTPTNKTSENNPTESGQTPTQTTAQQIHSWYTKYGDTLTTLSNDFGKVSTDATNLKIADLQLSCQQLDKDATSDLSVPTIPDATAAAHYSSGLTYAQQAAQSCVSGVTDYTNGINNLDSGSVSQATSEFKTMNSDVQLSSTQMKDTAVAVNQATGQQ
jgi:hypothetical protein